jgi:hypothetical protein
MGALGSIAGAIGLVVFRFAVASLQILARSQHISSLSAVVFSFWVSAQAIKTWIMAGALIGIGIALLWFWLAGNAKWSPSTRLFLTLWIIGLASFGWLQYQQHRDQAAIRVQYAQFCVGISEKRYESAYNHMTPDYRRKHTIDQFKADDRIEETLYSAIENFGCDLRPQHHIEVVGNKATLYPLTFEFSELYSGLALELKKTDGEWRFTGESHWYSD